MPIRWLTTIAVALALLGTANVYADRYPEHPVKLVLAFPAGGQSTVLGHLLADHLAAQWHEPVILDYRVGAGGTIAADHVAKARPDGYTLLLANTANFAIAQTQLPDLAYNSMRDFVLVGGVVHSSYALAINPGVPAKSVPELVAYLRAHPGRLNHGSSGNGTVSLLAAQMFLSETRTEMVHVPYKGTAAALSDLVGGHIDLTFAELSQVLPFAKAGSIRVLAIASIERSTLAPDLPTLVELGYPAIAIDSWNAIAVPAATPAEVVAVLRRSLIEALANPAVARRMDEMGYEIFDNARQDMRALLRSDIERFAAIAKRTSIPVPQ